MTGPGWEEPGLAGCTLDPALQVRHQQCWPPLLLPACPQILTPRTPPSSFLLSLSLPQSPRHHHGITAEQETQRDSPTSSLLACLGAQAPASQKLTTPFPSPFYPVFLLTEVVAQCCAEGEKNGVQVPGGLLGLPSMAMSIPVSFSASFSLTVH